MVEEKYWVERLENKNSFEWTFSLPMSKDNWQDCILELDEEFLLKGKKYGLFYFKKDVITDYKRKRKISFFNSPNLRIELLAFENYYNNGRDGYIEDLFIDIPRLSNGKFTTESICFHRPFINLQILELNNSTGLYLFDIENLEKGSEEIVYFSIVSASNIWWEEINYIEDENGNTRVLDSPKNNRPWAYRITPRLNSFIRDLKQKIIQLNGSILLEEFDKRYVTQEGILLDEHIIYQEDIEEGKVNLLEIDNQFS